MSSEYEKGVIFHFSAPAKKTRRGEKCADFGCLYEYIQQ